MTGWAAASNERAVANARAASTACSRRRVEREEVAHYLAARAARAARADVPGVDVASEGVDSLSG